VTSAAPGRPLASLTAEQEVTLRRIAFGESPVRTLRTEDLGTLHKLGLIEKSKDGPRLSASGRRLFRRPAETRPPDQPDFQIDAGGSQQGHDKRGL